MTPNHPPPGILDRTFDAVLFDMDGTLVSSTAAVERCWARMAEEFAIPTTDFAGFHGVPARAVLDRLMPERSAQEREVALRRVEELEIEDTDGVEVLPGALEALEVLGAAGPGPLCAIVTSCTGPLARARISAAGLPAVPMVTADEVTRGKPDPEPYLAGARLLGVDPGRCLVVEDAPAGVSAGSAAGMVTLGLATTHAELAADVAARDLGSVLFARDGTGLRVLLR